MTITLVRIDDRVIHGQITTRWTRARHAHGILAVGDDIAYDELRKKVLKAAAGDMKLGIYPVEQAPEKIAKAKAADKKYFVIATSPQTIAKLLEAGADLGEELNVGPMNTREGAKVLGRTVSIDEKDYEAFEKIEQHGMNISFQVIPDDDKKSWKSYKKKYDAM